MKMLSPIMTLGVLLLAMTASAEKYGDIVISPKTFLPPTSTYYHGYCEVTFQISNTSLQNAHMVTLSFPGDSSEITSTRALRVGPGTTVNSVLYLPASSFYSHTASVEIDGRRQSDELPVSSPSMGYNSYYSSPSDKPLYILRSRNVASSIADAFETKSSSSSSADIKVWRSESDVQNWPDNFLAYTPCDAIIIDVKDVSLLKPAARDALKQYVSAGGLLAISGLEAVPADFSMRPSYAIGKEKCASFGFGRSFVFSAGSNLAGDADFARCLNEQHGLLCTESLESLSGTFSIVDMNRLPVKGMLIMLVIFSILIGPVLMIVLSKYRKRIWMFWLVPLISLVACLGLFIFSVVSEGFTPTVKTRTLTVLDENTNQATTIGLYGIYAPLTPGNGLTFSVAAELRDVAESESRRGKTIDWGENQKLEKGWVAARVPTYLNIRKCQTRRERVNVKYKGDTPVSIVNGLGADIKNLKYYDAKGNVYVTGEVAAGQEASLVRSGGAVKKIRRSLFDELRNAYAAGLWNISQSTADAASTETYRAELKSDPFISKGVANPKIEQNCIVIGICRRTGNAD